MKMDYNCIEFHPALLMFRLLFAGDEFWNAHGLSEAGVSFRELPKTFKSDVAWIWGTAPV